MRRSTGRHWQDCGGGYPAGVNTPFLGSVAASATRSTSPTAGTVTTGRFTATDFDSVDVAARGPAAGGPVGQGEAVTPIDLGDLLGYSVLDVDDDDPVLLDNAGNAVDTWREGYPYSSRMTRDEYELKKRLLQIELLKLQSWIKESNRRLVIVFEGRDAAGKGGTIKRFTEHLNPRGARTVALEKPTSREETQWYFQRYIEHLPAAGEIVLFDRSWYNRAGVERVMGYCSDAQYREFIRQAPAFENLLVGDGIDLVKLWFSVSRAEQLTRFAIRQVDPVRTWKLSPNDIASLDKWDAYTDAKEAMFQATDTDEAPWTVVKSNDKKRARVEAMNFVASLFDYPGKDRSVVSPIDSKIVGPAAEVFEHGERV
jgi:polyphosphate kinase 2